MANPQKTIKRGETRIPVMTYEERATGARGFFIVDNSNPLPTGATAYHMIVNADAVITAYEERKAEGGGNSDMLAPRNLAGITLKAGIPLTPPKHNPCSVLEVSSGEIVCYLEDANI